MTKIIYTRKGEEILVDDEDYERLSALTWRIDSGTGYVVRTTDRDPVTRKKSTEHMHRVIFGLSKGDGVQVDHWNHNRSDNRKNNLRVCTQFQNQRNIRTQKNNTSGFKGVTFDRRTRRWIAQITVDRTLHFLGRFTSPELAHAAYRDAATKMHGEFACLD